MSLNGSGGLHGAVHEKTMFIEGVAEHACMLLPDQACAWRWKRMAGTSGPARAARSGPWTSPACALTRHAPGTCRNVPAFYVPVDASVAQASLLPVPDNECTQLHMVTCSSRLHSSPGLGLSGTPMVSPTV